MLLLFSVVLACPLAVYHRAVIAPILASVE